MTAQWKFRRHSADQFELQIDTRKGGDPAIPIEDSREVEKMHQAIRRMFGEAERLPAGSRSLRRVGPWKGECHLPDGTRFQVAAVTASGPILSLVCKSPRSGFSGHAVNGFLAMVNAASEPPPAVPAVPEGRAEPQTEKEDDPMALYMVRGFHDWMFGRNRCLRGKYVLMPGFRRLVGQAEKVISVHYAHLRDDWEDDFRRALDAWEEAGGFEFREVDNPETAEIVVDDEEKGAYMNRSLRFTGRKDGGGLWIMESENRIINIAKEWPQQQLDYAMVHELGHILGLGHPGPYNGERPKKPLFEEDDTSNTVMSYFGRPAAAPGPADVRALKRLYGSVEKPGSENASRFVSESVGGTRFGFADRKFPNWAVTEIAGRLDGAQAAGVRSLYEARPGDGTGCLWLVVERGRTYRSVRLSGKDVPIGFHAHDGDCMLFRSRGDRVPWPSVGDRRRGVDVEFVD